MRKKGFWIGLPLLMGLSCLDASAEVKVVTSIKPLQLIAAEVQEGLGVPEALVPPGSSPHSFALRPSTVRDLQNADLVYWIGPDLETYLRRPLESRSGKTVALQNLDGLHIRYFGDTKLGSDDRVASDDHELSNDDHDDLHRPGSIDAHLWLNPGNALIIANQMADDLAIADPQNAERYKANFLSFRERLEHQDDVLKRRLGLLGDRPFFLTHQTYDYFEEAYGLQHTGVLAISNEVQPGARHVAQLRDKLKKAGSSCIFYEPPLRPKLAETLTAGLSIRFAEVDALGYGIDAQRGGYNTLIDRLGDAIAECLGAVDLGLIPKS